MPFPVSCPACGKSFSIADDAYEQKIKGRVVSVKCKQCQGLIRVDGTRPPEARRSNAPAEPPPAFLVDTPGATDRELTGPQIAEEIRAGRMTDATLVWREGMPEWTEASNVPALAPFLKPSAAQPAPQPAKEPAKEAPRSQEGARPAKIRPMQPTLPMGMMAPPSLAARGITLPLSPAVSARSTPEAQTAVPVSVALVSHPPAAPAPYSQEPEGDGAEDATIARANVADLLPPIDELVAPARAPAPRSAPKVGPAAGSPPHAAPSPGSAPKAAPAPRAVPIPTPMPRQAGSSPRTASPPRAPSDAWGTGTQLGGFGEAPPEPPAGDAYVPPAPHPYSAPSAHPYVAPSAVPGPRGSAFPTARAPAGLMGSPSMGPAGMAPVPAAPRPFPDSFPAAAPIDDLEFRPKRGKTIGILIAIVVVIGIVIAIVASSGPSTPAVPVPTVVPTPEPRTPVGLPTPTPTPTPAPTPASTSIPSPNTGGDPLNPSAPATAPRAGNDFTDLFAQGAKKLNPTRPPGSSAPPPSPLTPP